MPAMPKRIDFADIEIGDTIRVVEVNDVTESGNVYAEHSVRPGATRGFELVNRPLPELPTEIGSVIELHGKGTWILIHEVTRGKGIWINTHSGVRNSAAFMRQRVEIAGGFEVIL